MKEINKAYETLTNPRLRATYDSSRRKTSEKKPKKGRKQGQGLKLHYVNAILAIIIVVLFVFCPNISKAYAQGQVVNFALSDDWQAAMVWMKDNTPDPMGDRMPITGTTMRRFPARSLNTLHRHMPLRHGGTTDTGLPVSRTAYPIPTRPSRRAPSEQ